MTNLDSHFNDFNWAKHFKKFLSVIEKFFEAL